MMKIIDLAKEFADLNIFNEFTHATLMDKVKVFCQRSGVDSIEDLSLDSIACFKRKTLDIAQPITYNGYIRYMRLVIDHAISRNLTDKNLFRSVRLAPVGAVPRKVLERETIDEMCNHIYINPDSFKPSWFWLTVIYALYFTGMRRRQLVSLKLADINFKDEQILLSYEGSKTHRSWLIPMHEEVSSRLQDLILRTEQVMGRRMRPNDYLFVASRFYPRYSVTSKGNMKPDAITGFFKRLSRDLGKPVGAHRFRHTFATELCNPGDDSPPDIFAVQSILGHTNVQTTRNYVQTSTDRMEMTINRINTPFSKRYSF
jgi:integrase